MTATERDPGTCPERNDRDWQLLKAMRHREQAAAE